MWCCVVDSLVDSVVLRGQSSLVLGKREKENAQDFMVHKKCIKIPEGSLEK